MSPDDTGSAEVPSRPANVSARGAARPDGAPPHKAGYVQMSEHETATTTSADRELPAGPGFVVSSKAWLRRGGPVLVAWVATVLVAVLATASAMLGPVRYDPLVGLTALTVVGLIWYTYFTRRTLTHLQDSSKQQLRAYLEVDFPYNDPNSEPPNRHDVVIDVYNCGQSPARNVRLAAWYEIAYSDKTHPHDESAELRADMHDGPQPCAPGTGPASRLRFAIRPRKQDHERIASVRAGSAGTFLYVFGTIEYDDVFGDRRITRFCARLEPEPLERVDRYGWRACDQAEHNSAT